MTARTFDPCPIGWQYATKRVVTQMRQNFASDRRRAVETVLGLVWVVTAPLLHKFAYARPPSSTASTSRARPPQSPSAWVPVS